MNERERVEKLCKYLLNFEASDWHYSFGDGRLTIEKNDIEYTFYSYSRFSNGIAVSNPIDNEKYWELSIFSNGEHCEPYNEHMYPVVRTTYDKISQKVENFHSELQKNSKIDILKKLEDFIK